MYFRIDRKKKIPITTLLYALGKTREEILRTFYSYENIPMIKKLIHGQQNLSEKYKRPIKLQFDLIDKKTKKY